MHVETDDVSPIELGEYEYYGLHWRSVKRSDTSQTPDGLDEQRLLYYNAAWQLIEERIDEDYTGSPGTDSIAELFWGIRYIDDLMLRRVDESAAGTTFKRWYPLTDAQFSVRAVLRDDAGVHERINYSPYGVAEHHWGGDVNNDRSGDFFDILALGDQVGLGDVDIGEANYVAEMDLNRDGTLDGDDVNAMVTGTALPSGWISAAGAGNPGNVIGFDGYVFNPEIETYTVRFRWYDPELGRWLQRDPAGYVERANLYEYVRGMPTTIADAWGLGPWEWVKKKLRSIKNGAEQAFNGAASGLGPGEMWDASYGASASQARKLAKEIAAELVDPDCEHLSDEKAIENAARHIIWQAMLTIKHGDDTASTVGDIHESGHEGTRDSEADQHNNEIGRDIGRHWRREKGSATTAEDLKQAAKGTIKMGMSISNMDDPRLNPSNPVNQTSSDSSCDSCPSSDS